MNELVEEFLRKAANRPERRFWIGRTYMHMQHVSEDDTVRLWGDLQSYRLPRKIRDVKHLDIIAKYWKFETTHNRSPSHEEMIQIMGIERERT